MDTESPDTVTTGPLPLHPQPLEFIVLGALPLPTTQGEKLALGRPCGYHAGTLWGGSRVWVRVGPRGPLQGSAGPTDPLLVVDPPLVVFAHHHLDAPLPVIPLQDDSLGEGRDQG